MKEEKRRGRGRKGKRENRQLLNSNV